MNEEVEARELTIGMANAAQTNARSLPDFDSLLLRFERKVIGTAMRMLGNREDAQDAAQEVLMRLYKYRNSLDSSRDPSPWIYRTTINVCFDIRRKRREFPLADAAEVEDPGESTDERLDRESKRAALQRALLRLPEKMRAAVVLRDVEGLTTREVAEILGSSEVTVRTQVCQARLRLRKLVRRS